MEKLNLEGKIDLGTAMILWRAVNVPQNIFDLIEKHYTMKSVSYVAYIPDHICQVDGLPRFMMSGTPFALNYTEQLPCKEGTLVIGYH